MADTLDLSPFCVTKSHLERRIWDLVDRFCGLSSRLAGLAGTNRQAAFASAKVECRSTHSEIVDLRRQLEAHQSEHGC